MAWISINFESKALGMPVMTNVLMPQGRGGYKTLYLLHGAGGDYASWLLKSRVADYAEGNNIAVVMPSGNNKCYVNNRYGKDYFTFLTEELIEKCETWFDLSPKKEDRFIAGMSMGGYGAVHAAFSPLSKVVLMFDMLAGRLEMIPMLLLFTPATWRKQ